MSCKISTPSSRKKKTNLKLLISRHQRCIHTLLEKNKDEWAIMCKTQTCKFVLCNEDTWMVFLCKVDRSKVDRYEWGEKYIDRDLPRQPLCPRFCSKPEFQNVHQDLDILNSRHTNSILHFKRLQTSKQALVDESETDRNTILTSILGARKCNCGGKDMKKARIQMCGGL